MKIYGIISTLFLSYWVHAQTVDVKDVNANSEQNTTIEIKKGSKTTTNEWEVHDGVADIQGDPGIYTKEAKQNWKAACNEWKKEFRTDNKENKIIAMSCGTPNCEKGANDATCTSKATYKIKTKVN